MQHLAVITTPTRFPLGTGSAFEKFEKSCFLSREQVSYHLPNTPLHPATTHVLIQGPDAFKKVFPGIDHEKACGTFMLVNKFPATTTHHSQVADDFKMEDLDDEGGAGEGGADKDTALTRHTNYRFWIRADTLKLLSNSFKIPPPEKRFSIYPSMWKVVNWLNSLKNETLYLDIECRRGDHSLNCIGLATATSSIVVVPTYTYSHHAAYGDLPLFHRALVKALHNNNVVIHNALFDLFVLGYRYRISCRDSVYDTMLAHHRCFPEVEKSLGHAIRYWTWLPYHKDQNVENPRSAEQDRQLWTYNAEDVYSMREVHKAQLLYANSHPSIAASIEQANKSIIPYLYWQLSGLAYDQVELAQLRTRHYRYLKQYERIARILSNDPLFNPNSTDQAIKFFHNKLGYDVQGRTDKGKPALGAKELYKLRLKYPNPLLDVILAYRFLQKEASMMEFVPFKLHSTP